MRAAFSLKSFASPSVVPLAHAPIHRLVGHAPLPSMMEASPHASRDSVATAHALGMELAPSWTFRRRAGRPPRLPLKSLYAPRVLLLPPMQAVSPSTDVAPLSFNDSACVAARKMHRQPRPLQSMRPTLLCAFGSAFLHSPSPAALSHFQNTVVYRFLRLASIPRRAVRVGALQQSTSSSDGSYPERMRVDVLVGA
ncbi:hypothetical protein DFH09DRAFT_324796 [Mycena vulgaris]|nr:hypothetical protein DFH09DRAFT_324796 [Mycena vulgaris]